MIEKKVNYKIIDNFISNKDLLSIQSLFLDPQITSPIPWYYNAGTSRDIDYSDAVEDYYFCHVFYIGNEPVSKNLLASLLPIIDKLNSKSLIRVKSNLYPSTSKRYHHPNHFDLSFPHKGAIFYVNTNDGFTVLEDGTEIKSIENRVLLFDPSTKHHSTTCTDKKVRITINFNYF